MSQNTTIVFVCEHGAAKSILAAAYFNRLAQASGSKLHAIARGTHPDNALSAVTVDGLAKDGLTPTEAAPQKLTAADLRSAQKVITFCELPEELQQPTVEQWEAIPPVSENYERARDAILERIQRMFARGENPS